MRRIDWRGKKEEVVGGLVSPGSCYVSHYVSHGHRQHANRQNKRVSLAWHGSYFPILGAGSERGQAAGWGAGGIVGSGLASKTQRPRVQVPAESNQGEIWECHSWSARCCSVAQLSLFPSITLDCFPPFSFSPSVDTKDKNSILLT